MSTEALWYASYSEPRQWGSHIIESQPPHIFRLIRLPWREQLGAAFDLALAVFEGDAGCRPTWNTVTGETTWRFPMLQRAGKDGPWWYLPPRTTRLKDRVLKYAEMRAQAALARRSHADGEPINTYSETIKIELRRLRRRAYRAAGSETAAAADWDFNPRKPAKRNTPRAPRPQPLSPRFWASRRRRRDILGYRHDIIWDDPWNI